MEASFETLRKIQLQERRGSVLTPLEEDFFERCRELLARLNKKFQEGGGIAEGKELANTESVFRDVVEAREKKIIWKVLSDHRSGASSGNAALDGLTREEKKFYSTLAKALSDFDASALSGKDVEAVRGEAVVEATEQTLPLVQPAQAAPAPMPASTPASPARLKARVLKDLPEFVWRDSACYGPFKKGELIEVSAEIASFLREKNVVELA